jgi:tRNA pseudouridine55 synthase
VHILEATKKFIGTIEQVPPIFSALKKDGKRLYEYARDGIEVEIKKRRITISDFEITEVKMPEVTFRVRCSKGTYIRSLAHDFGKALQSGAHLSALRRTKIGDYNVNNAQNPVDFEQELLGKLKDS